MGIRWVSDDSSKTSTQSIGIGGEIQDRMLIFKSRKGRCKNILLKIERDRLKSSFILIPSARDASTVVSTVNCCNVV